MDNTIISKLCSEKGLRILAALHDSKIENYTHNLAGPADTTKANATRIINQFKAAGLVEERDTKTDGRKKLLQLTDKGEGFANAAALYIRHLDHHVTTGDDTGSDVGQPRRGGDRARSYST